MRDVKNIEDHYYGDIDSDGNACGFGVIGYKNQYQKHIGTFFNNKIHGICKPFSRMWLSITLGRYWSSSVGGKNEIHEYKNG